MPGPRRVLLVLPDLSAGGAQRVTLSLLEHLPRERFEPHLALGERVGPFLPRVPRDVAVHDLDANRARRMPRPLRRLAAELEPQTIFSTLYYTNLMLLLQRRHLPPGTRLVVREAAMASGARGAHARIRAVEWLSRKLYRRADRVICQCVAMADELHTRSGVPRELLTTIYNPVDREALRRSARAGQNPFAARGLGPHVVGVGRLFVQKGFDRLVDAIPALVSAYPQAQVWLLGEDAGEAEPLRERARRLGVGDRLHLLGFQEDPERFTFHADLYVQTSRREGLPNGLLEALAVGCPVIALPEPGGTREALELAGVSERLVERLDWPRWWFRGGPEGAPEPDLEAFALERAIGAYAELLEG